MFAPLVPIDRVWVERRGGRSDESERTSIGDVFSRLVSLDAPPRRDAGAVRDMPTVTGRRVVLADASRAQSAIFARSPRSYQNHRRRRLRARLRRAGVVSLGLERTAATHPRGADLPALGGVARRFGPTRYFRYRAMHSRRCARFSPWRECAPRSNAPRPCIGKRSRRSTRPSGRSNMLSAAAVTGAVRRAPAQPGRATGRDHRPGGTGLAERCRSPTSCARIPTGTFAEPLVPVRIGTASPVAGRDVSGDRAASRCRAPVDRRRVAIRVRSGCSDRCCCVWSRPPRRGRCGSARSIRAGRVRAVRRSCSTVG